MSTRATYTVDTTDFYIHYDGYPSGAASYLENAVQYLADGEPHPVNFSFRDIFHLANPGYAEHTNAAQHGDTEYHYMISNVHTDEHFVGNLRGRESLSDIRVKAYARLYSAAECAAHLSSVEDIFDDGRNWIPIFDGDLFGFLHAAINGEI